MACVCRRIYVLCQPFLPYVSCIGTYLLASGYVVLSAMAPSLGKNVILPMLQRDDPLLGLLALVLVG